MKPSYFMNRVLLFVLLFVVGNGALSQERIDTLYYSRSGVTVRNPVFADYYRLALYPADSAGLKMFKDFYISGELRREGHFQTIDTLDDCRTVFDGDVVSYFKNGHMSEKSYYSGGLLEGEYRQYDENGTTTWKMAQMNLAIRGIEADLGQYNADTFFNDCHPTLKADFVMANPPFNLSDWGADKLADDVRWKYGTPPNGNANFAWIQHIIHHLAPTGRAGVVLANGSLSSQSGGEGEIRRKLVEADLVDCVIAMPPQLFYTTQIPVSIWFFNKNKQQKGKTLFIDARNLGTMVTRKLRELTDSDTVDPIKRGDIQRIADTYNAYVAGKLENEKGFCVVTSVAEIAKQDFILTPGRYVGIAAQEEDTEPFEEKMTRLTGELSGLFEKSHELEAEIKKQLGSIGYKL